MAKVKDLTGMKFGMLTVIERTEKPEHIKNRGAYWLCKCECGNTKTIKGYSLTSGVTTSCGCSLINDLIGMRFGRLTVIEYVGKSKWICKCECGNEKIVYGTNLKSGRTISCGCYNSEKTKRQWQDEEYRQMMTDQSSEIFKKKWQDEDFRQTVINKSSETFKKKWQDEDFRQMQSEKGSKQMKQLWQDEEMKWKMGYKGGITPISEHLRHLNVQWYNLCKQQANYTCQLTGQVGGQLHTHHLKAFNTIVKEAHNLHNIQIKDQVKDYTQEELKLLEEYVESWHKDNSNAVVLSEDVHTLFHKLYGKGENTPEQYMEFKERYLAGEFKEILK